MKSAGEHTRPLLGCSLTVLLILGLSLSLAGAENGRPDNETCLACHEGYEVALAGTAHALSPPPRNVDLYCASCHTGGDEHIEDPVPENIGNPATLPATEVITLCQDCHVPHAEMDNAGFDPHAAQGQSCLSCHSIHQGQAGLLTDDKTEFCGRCHVVVSASFGRRSRHPLADGAVNCLSCHSFSGANEPQYGHGASANCYSCHPEQSGPYVYEHPAAISFAVEGGGCTECHQPHSSSNERLLSQPGNTLCLQCHGVPPGHRVEHSGLGTKLACVDCHSEIHGSNDNGKLLDPDLGMILFPDCYQSGCHIFDD